MNPEWSDTDFAHCRVVIRGQADDSAVLCTKNKTYDLKLAETSNTMLLLPDLKLSDTLSQRDLPDILHTEVAHYITPV